MTTKFISPNSLPSFFSLPFIGSLLGILSLLALSSCATRPAKSGDDDIYHDDPSGDYATPTPTEETMNTETIPDSLTRPEGSDPSKANWSTLSAQTIYFGFDSYSVRSSERSKLEKVKSWLSQNPSSKIVLAGHTDERGTTQYNIGLGERRALAVRNYLLGIGVDASRMTTISYGEEKPAQSGSSETAWALNRRTAIGVF